MSYKFSFFFSNVQNYAYSQFTLQEIFCRDAFRSPRRDIDDDLNEGFDELATVGFPDDTELSSLFEASGMYLFISELIDN